YAAMTLTSPFIVAARPRCPEHLRRRLQAWRRRRPGVTTSLVLPGSANAIGGQAAIIKLRPTELARSPMSMLLENLYEKNTTLYDPKVSFRYCTISINSTRGVTRDRAILADRFDHRAR
ncbi:hypothetical protein LXA43DRAFT_1053892, partial [Ganoderma leucocontextum]